MTLSNRKRERFRIDGGKERETDRIIVSVIIYFSALDGFEYIYPRHTHTKKARKSFGMARISSNVPDVST